MKTLKIILILFAFTLFLTNCEKEPLPPVDPEKEEAPELTQKVNVFIEDVMEDVYLWADNIPEIDTKYEFDSKAYFEKLIDTEDKWSFITEDVVALEGSFEGVETSFGWSLDFKLVEEGSDQVVAFVEFVYPDTPAKKAGMKRGDIIIKMNNADITIDNYLDLLYGQDISILHGQYSESGLINTVSVGLTSRELSLNPVVITNIIEHACKKIGYLFYAQYIRNFNTSLDTAFQYFMDQNVDDVVLDLRYNPGGGTVAAQHLCSSLAPLDAVNNKSTLVTFRWNNYYQTMWENENVSSQLKINFIDDTSAKMGLSRLYVLTGPGTASASELTITGLKPYMQVTTIGATTYGKYTASITLKPADIYTNESKNYYNDFKNWGIQPIVLRYANVQGVTDFKDGFLPDIEAEDNLYEPFQLGDKNEALLKVTLEEITGIEVTALALKSAQNFPDLKSLYRGFSKYDRNKREVLVDHLEKDFLK